MPVKPKIYTKEQVETLRKCYIDEKMSINEISKNSEKLFGVYCGNYNVHKALKRNNIKQRSFSESISLAMRELDWDRTYLTEDMLEWVDGFLLGDGSLSFGNEVFKEEKTLYYARFSIGSSEKQWTDYAMSKFSVYGARKAEESWYEGDKNPIWNSRTVGHPDIVKQVYRWYPLPDCKKIVPKDVRITPTSVMLWYLGDGSITNEKGLKFSTCGFTDKDIRDILIPKLEGVGIYTYIAHWKGYPNLMIRRESNRRFFEYIGSKSPISCYDYKFVMEEWYNFKRLQDVVKNDREKWRAQYFYKVGKLDCTKSPGGRFLLFTDEQEQKLKEMLSKSNKIQVSQDKIDMITNDYKNGMALWMVDGG